MIQEERLTKLQLIIRMNNIFKAYEEEEVISIENCCSTDELFFLLKEEIFNNKDNLPFISTNLVKQFYNLVTLYNDEDDNLLDQSEAEELISKLINYLNNLMIHLQKSSTKNNNFWHVYNSVVYYKNFIDENCGVSTDGSLIWLF